MKIEDIEIGMDVFVKNSTYDPVDASQSMIRHCCEVQGIYMDGIVKVWQPDKEYYWYFNPEDLEELI